MADPAVSDPESREIAKKEGVTRYLADQGILRHAASHRVTYLDAPPTACAPWPRSAIITSTSTRTTTTMNSPGSTKLNISGMRHLHDAPRGLEVLTRLEGIVLHVKEYEGQPPETMSFSKSASRTISVGRKPSQGYIADDPERALFRCPVVSRKHAKITFTEYGNVCHGSLCVRGAVR